MTIQRKITISSLGQPNSAIKIPLNLSFIPVDNTESAEYDFINEQTTLAINPVDDYEKVRFVPFSGITEIEFHLKDKLGNIITYADLGLSNDDLKFQRNRFKNSFLRLNFFDSNNPANQRLAFQQQLFNQLNEYNRDINGNLLDVSISPVIYKIIDPITIRRGVSEGYYLYWYDNPTFPSESYPINFYMYSSYANAVDGKNTTLISYNNPVDILQFNGVNYVSYNLSKFSGINTYRPIPTNREISVVGKKMIINLNIPNFI